MNSLKVSITNRNATITKMILVDHELFLNSSSKWYIKYHNVAAKINQLIAAIDDHILKGGSGEFDCVDGELVVSISDYESVKINMFEIDELVMSEIDCVLAGIYILNSKPTVSNPVEDVVSVADAWNCIGRKQPTNESADVYYWVVGGEAGSEPILARFNDYKKYGGRVNYWQTMIHDDFSMTGTKWIQVQKPKAH